MPTFAWRLTLAHPPERVFEVLAQPARRLALTPPEWHAQLLEGPAVIAPGTRLVVRMRHFGLPQRLASEVTEVVPGRRIVERQVEGPFQAFVHTQTLTRTPEGSTTLEDQIDYELPGGLLAVVLNADRVEKHLSTAFAFRDGALRQMLAEVEGPKP
jgi:ligand-binding SRPBCC domain-containing protein